MKTTIELADELEAEKKLRNAGYSKLRCPNARCLHLGKCCPQCGGNGYIWENQEALAIRMDRTFRKAEQECARWDKALDRWAKSGIFKQTVSSALQTKERQVVEGDS